MKRRMLLFSFFVSENIGDLQLASNLYSVYSSRYDVVCIDFCTLKLVDPSSVKEINWDQNATHAPSVFSTYKNLIALHLYKSWKKRINKLVPSFDLVCLAGGNMMMDLTFISNFSYIARYIADSARKNHKELVVSHVGVGPAKTALQRIYIGSILKSAVFCSLRDEPSVHYARSLCSCKTILTADPVFLDDCRPADPAKRTAIAINIFGAAGYESPERVINGYCNLIMKLSQKFKHHNIILFATEKADKPVLDAVYSRCRDCITKIVFPKNVDQLLDVYSESSVAITARMHSGVFAVTQHVPVIPLKWQEKVAGFAKECRIEERLIDFFALFENADRVVSLVNDVLDTEETAQFNIQQVHDELKKIAKAGFYQQ